MLACGLVDVGVPGAGAIPGRAVGVVVALASAMAVAWWRAGPVLVKTECVFWWCTWW